MFTTRELRLVLSWCMVPEARHHERQERVGWALLVQPLAEAQLVWSMCQRCVVVSEQLLIHVCVPRARSDTTRLPSQEKSSPANVEGTPAKPPPLRSLCNERQLPFRAIFRSTPSAGVYLYSNTTPTSASSLEKSASVNSLLPLSGRASSDPS